jgi:hypothetical protein
MVFRMGADAQHVRRALARGGGFRSPACRSAVGLATDEALPAPARSERVYLFHPGRSWNQAALVAGRTFAAR